MTGVQTCALPIYLIRAALSLDPADLPVVAWRPPNSAVVRDLEGRLREVVRQRAAAQTHNLTHRHPEHRCIEGTRLLDLTIAYIV